MKWDLLIASIPSLIGATVQAVESIKAAKTGAEKEAAVLTSVKSTLSAAEDATGIDFVNDPALDGLMKSYIAARIALMNGVQSAKNLKPEKK